MIIGKDIKGKLKLYMNRVDEEVLFNEISNQQGSGILKTSRKANECSQSKYDRPRNSGYPSPSNQMGETMAAIKGKRENQGNLYDISSINN